MHKGPDIKHLGFQGNQQEVLSIWGKNSKTWNMVGSPWRPSTGDIVRYEKLAGKKAGGHVLVLGSTPELRDFVLPHSPHVTVIDTSEAMLLGMRTLMKASDTSKENLVVADWCNGALTENHFDLILGDMIWWVVSIEKQHALRDKIAGMLKPAGVFVSRFRVRDPNITAADPRQTIDRYLARTTPDNKRFIRDALLSTLYDLTADIPNKRLNRTTVKNLLLETAEVVPDLRDKDFLRESAGHLLSADWTSQTREEILSMLGEKFLIKGEHRADDYESDCYPIFSFEKRPHRHEY